MENDPKKLNIQEVAKNHLIKIKDLYLHTPIYLLEHYEQENKIVLEHIDREILELLQNADDAAETAVEPKAFIKLTNKNLVVANTGQTFTEDGLNSIFHNDLSPKFRAKKQIGNKGLGFKSILSWSKKVTIISGDLQISFSREHSNEILEELIKEEPLIEKEIIKRYGKKENAIAILRCPEIISNFIKPDEFEIYDTLIIIDLKDKMYSIVEEQLNKNIDPEMMLFLNNLNAIDIITPTSKKTIKREILKDEKINEHASLKKIRISNDHNGVKTYDWNIHLINGIIEKTKEREEKNYELAVAWQDDLTERKNVLHTFFRTDVTFKFPGILHGTFELSSNRTELIKGHGYNKLLFIEAAILIAKTSQIIAENENSSANYKALKFSMVDFSSLNSLIKESGFEFKLKEELKKATIFPSINNKYLNWSSRPVYYKEQEFSNLLDPQRFPLLLKYCAETNMESLIETFGPRKYSLTDIIKIVSEGKNSYSVEDYAKLISVIHNHIDINLYSLSLFYDKKRNLLTFNEALFLPKQKNTKKTKELPPEIGVQIISKVLIENLIKIIGCINYSDLTSKLFHYKLKEYNFVEIVTIIIDRISDPKISTDNFIKLHNYLFEIYKIEENPGIRWEGPSVLLVNKKGEKCSAAELYFGKDYQNPLTEKIYEYNKSKILASPRKFKIVKKDENAWIKYFKWLGVEYFPKEVILYYGDQRYADYVMKQYNYRNSIGGYRFEDFKGFKNAISSYNLIKVTSIDDIDRILENNTSEDILKLIIKAGYNTKILDRDNEPDLSYISFKLYNERKETRVNGSRMNSYLLWKFQYSAWLKTEYHEKYPPVRCSIAQYINEDFAGLIEKPKIDYEKLLKIKIKREKIDLILSTLGVNKSMNTLPTSILFSILLKIGKDELEPKKAKTIYNQIASAKYSEKSLDKIDKEDTNYIEFQRSGRVLCKNGKYFPINEVYYVEDKRYAASVLKYFNIIEIERRKIEIEKRKGIDKIKRLFGVLPLRNVNITIEGTPILHPLNSIFHQEIELFKPYIYVLIKDIDEGDKKNILKDTHIKLVNKLEEKLSQKNGQLKIIELTDYEYYYSTKSNIIYIKVSEEISDLQILKEDVNFGTVISEIFTIILEFEGDKYLIRELFSKSTYGREDLLRNEIDDNYLAKLNEAKLLFGMASDPKLEFWKAYLKCFKKNFKLSTNTDADLIEYLKKSLPKHSHLIEEVFEQINYQELNEENSLESIIKLFKSSDILIEKFNIHHSPEINIQNLYSLRLKRSIDEYFEKFKTLYYKHCLKNITLQANFTNKINEYLRIIPSFKNEINFDAKTDLIDLVHKKFEINLLKKCRMLNLDEVYLQNKDRLWYDLNCKIKRELFDQFFNDNPDCNSLIYFEDQIKFILEKINKWLGKNNESENSSKSKRISFGEHTILFNGYSDLKDQIDGILQTIDLSLTNISKINTSRIELVKNNEKNGNSGHTKTFRTRNQREEIGFIGEYFVYQTLLSKAEIKANVKWVSQYAKDCGINLNGTNELGYDIEYIPNGSKYLKYVEVKVIGTDDAFPISSNEVRKGEEIKKHYEIFLVRSLSPNDSKIEIIEGLFDYKGRSFNDNDLFTVVNQNYIIKFKKQ